MILTLKNKENIRLEWNYLVLEYLEEREGSIEALQESINNLNGLQQIKISNSFVYAVIQANTDEIYTYKQAIRLVDPNDYERIFKFITKQLEIQDSFKKKSNNKRNGNHKRKEIKK